MGDVKPHRRLVIAGFVLAATALVLPILAVAAVAAGIVAVVAGRAVAGALIIALGVAFGLASTAFYTLALDPYRVPSQSMEPTLEVGSRFVVSRLSKPDVGDVVVVEPPAGADTSTCGVRHAADQACPRATAGRSDVRFIERVVAAGGDRVKVIDGRAYVNGKRTNEPFIRPDSECGLCDLPAEVTIPDGHVFLMGDNRGESADSRIWGPIPEDWVMGDAVLRYWPLQEFGGL